MLPLLEWSFCKNNRISDLSLRNSYHELKQPFRKTGIGQNALYLIAPSLWYKIPKEAKRTTSLNKFKHDFKKNYLAEIERSSF